MQKHQKKSQNGVLCGFPGQSSINTATKQDENSTPPERTISPRKRPQSLTLAFENRERESHLLTDEQIDQILRQEALNQPLPPLPNEKRRSISGLSRRSPSKVHRRPVSEDLSRLVPSLSQKFQDQRATPTRDSTMTALPRPPTMNEMFAYPQHPASKQNSDNNRQHSPSQSRPSHKRAFSAADILESMKKRIKTTDSEDKPQSHPTISKPLKANPSISSKNDSLKMSIFKRAQARLSISSTHSKDPSKSSAKNNQMRDEKRSSIATSGHSDSSTAYFASSEKSRPGTPLDPAYEYVSGPVMRRTFRERIGAPPSKRHLNGVVARQQNRIVDLTLQNNVLVGQIEILRERVEGLGVKMEGIEQAGGSREESDGGRRDIDATGARRRAIRVGKGVDVGDLSRDGPDGGESSDGDWTRHGEDQYPVLLRNRRGAVSARGGVQPEMMREESFDPAGWRKIVGIREDEDLDDMEMNVDDKRKTWMTCDS